MQETEKVRDFIKRMYFSFKKHKFSGNDPTIVLDFLSRFVQEVNIQEMSKAQSFITLPSFLEGFPSVNMTTEYESLRERMV